MVREKAGATQQRRTEPQRVVLARAWVDDQNRIEAEPVARIEAEVGRPLTLVMTYRFREASAERDTYEFWLESKVGTQKPGRVERTHKDIPLVPDDANGLLEQRFVFDEPGTYEGVFSAGSRHKIVGRRNDTTVTDASATTDGSFIVEVAAPAGEGRDDAAS